jgi:hypothetical protein
VTSYSVRDRGQGHPRDLGHGRGHTRDHGPDRRDIRDQGRDHLTEDQGQDLHVIGNEEVEVVPECICIFIGNANVLVLEGIPNVTIITIIHVVVVVVTEDGTIIISNARGHLLNTEVGVVTNVTVAMTTVTRTETTLNTLNQNNAITPLLATMKKVFPVLFLAHSKTYTLTSCPPITTPHRAIRLGPRSSRPDQSSSHRDQSRLRNLYNSDYKR